MVQTNLKFPTATFQQVRDEGRLLLLFFLLLLSLGFLLLFFLLAGQVSSSEVSHQLADILVSKVIHFHFSITKGLIIIRVGVRIMATSSSF